MRKDAYGAPGVNGARFLRLLADDTRLRILSLLLRADELCVCELVAILRLPQYQISRHLGQLRLSGVLNAHRRGPFVFYTVMPAARRHRVHGAILRAVPHLAGPTRAASDLGRMRRLMRLEAEQRPAACDAVTTAGAVRSRPILRVINAGR